MGGEIQSVVRRSHIQVRMALPVIRNPLSGKTGVRTGSTEGGSEVAGQRELENLEVWQMSQRFAVKICKELLVALPPEEKYALTEQLRRAAQSIPANIAEAHGRYHYADAVRFCYVARGSLEEAWSHILLAEELGYLASAVVREYRPFYDRLGKLINGYIRFLKRELSGSRTTR